MSTPDFNLLLTLDAVLSEGSVAGAARRLRLSPSAMSRALARLRETTGDPLLVRAGRGLAPTPRALALREQVGQLVQEARSVLRPADTLDLARLSRTFVLRTREGIVENFGAALIARAARQAPGVRLCFLPKGDKENSGLRDGTVDLETGVVGALAGPEIRIQSLFRDRYVGVVRRAHALAGKSATLARYLQASHIAISRRARERGPVDDALQLLARERSIGTVVGGFSAALALARESDLVATVPERHTGKLRKGMHTFELPFDMAPLTISLLWHPRQHADPAHQWLRALMLDVCRNDG